MAFQDKGPAWSGSANCTFHADDTAASQNFRKQYETRTNVVKAEDMPWERCADGLIKHLVHHRLNTRECCVEAYMQFLNTGERSGKHRHMWEEIIFVVEGSGYDLHWDMRFDCLDAFKWEWAEVPKKFEWKEGDYIYIPPFTLNPGASFRGLHDSLINSGGNEPPMMLCQHEEIAVQIAHGYAKASGKPMVAILHNLVGLLHANMAIYYAYADRAPVFIIGATGPMDETKRRPRIDWIHTALVQGEAVRAYTKWDYQPTVIDGVPESFARAYAVMMTEPRGPIYMCYDAWLQEQPLERDVPLPPPSAQKVPAPMAPDPAALVRAADMLANAKRPVILAEFVGREAAGFHALIELAETLGAPVWDVNARLNFPSRHPLNLSMVKAVFRDADVLLCLDTRDWERATTELVSTTRQVSSVVPPRCKWIDIGFGDLEISSWAMDYQRLAHADLRILADTTLAIPQLTALLKSKVRREQAAGRRAAAEQL